MNPGAETLLRRESALRDVAVAASAAAVAVRASRLRPDIAGLLAREAVRWHAGPGGLLRPRSRRDGKEPVAWSDRAQPPDPPGGPPATRMARILRGLAGRLRKPKAPGKAAALAAMALTAKVERLPRPPFGKAPLDTEVRLAAVRAERLAHTAAATEPCMPKALPALERINPDRTRTDICDPEAVRGGSARAVAESLWSHCLHAAEDRPWADRDGLDLFVLSLRLPALAPALAMLGQREGGP